jgi:hypothetical protein
MDVEVYEPWKKARKGVDMSCSPSDGWNANGQRPQWRGGAGQEIKEIMFSDAEVEDPETVQGGEGEISENVPTSFDIGVHITQRQVHESRMCRYVGHIFLHQEVELIECALDEAGSLTQDRDTRGNIDAILIVCPLGPGALTNGQSFQGR